MRRPALSVSILILGSALGALAVVPVHAQTGSGGATDCTLRNTCLASCSGRSGDLHQRDACARSCPTCASASSASPVQTKIPKQPSPMMRSQPLTTPSHELKHPINVQPWGLSAGGGSSIGGGTA